MSSILDAMAGALKLPAVESLRAVSAATVAGTRARMVAAAPVISGLEIELGRIINGPKLSVLLPMLRLVNQRAPGVEEVREGFARFGQRLRADPAFFSLVANDLPDIARDYGSSNFTQIANDPRFLRLLKEARQ